MASSQPQNGGIIAGINVTPLVDITLVLLIIMMVTAKILVTPAVPLDLPRSSKSEEVQSVFSVIVPAEGPLLVNGVVASSDQALTEKAQEAVNGDAEVRAVINADGAVSHRRVMQVLDILKNTGITKVAFGALPDEAN